MKEFQWLKLWLPGVAIAVLIATVASLAQAASYTFCLRYDDDRYWDASVRSGVDFGEDVGRNTGPWKVRHIAATVVEVTGGATKFNGQVDANGCTAQFNSSSDKFNIYYSPSYITSATGVSYKVYDCPGGTNCVFPVYSLLAYDPAATSGTYYPTLPVSSPMDAYVSIAVVVERFLGGIYANDLPYHYIRVNNTGSVAENGFTNTIWDSANGYPIVRLADAGTRSKFTTAHEFGHGIMLDRLGGWYVLDCSYGSGGSSSHTMQGLEYQSCAMTEGFAHFVATLAWNNYPDDADGVYVQAVDGDINNVVVYDAESGSGKIYDYCSGSACAGFGVEYDWLRAWWDYKTDGSTSHPLNSQILRFLETADPWDSRYDHFEDLYWAVDAELGSTQSTRFYVKAVANGTQN